MRKEGDKTDNNSVERISWRCLMSKKYYGWRAPLDIGSNWVKGYSPNDGTYDYAEERRLDRKELREMEKRLKAKEIENNLSI